MLNGLMPQPSISVSGIIGAGKTSLCEILHERFGWELLAEPVDDNPYLGLFYKDMKAYSFQMQIFLLVNRFNGERKAGIRDEPILMDRSVYEQIIFENMLHDDKMLTDLDHQTYMSTFKTLSTYIRRPDYVLFLDVDPEVALERIKRRGRECEKGISIEYLTKLREGYIKWIAQMNSLGTRVIELCWNADKEMDGGYLYGLNVEAVVNTLEMIKTNRVVISMETK